MPRKPGPNDPINGTYKMTPELIEKLLKFLREGLPKTYACAGVGIDLKTLTNWVNEFPEFRVRVEEAQKVYIEQNLAAIRAAGARRVNDKDGKPIIVGDWRANGWLMERRFPKEFGNRMEHALEEGTANTLADAIKAVSESRK